MKIRISLCLILAAMTIQAHATERPDVATLATCTACHGDKGQGNVSMGTPRLAGQQAAYLLQQLRNFKAGRRGYNLQDSFGAQMRSVVSGLDDAELERLANHFAGVNLVKTTATRTDDVAQGKALYQGTCASCHGSKGEGFAHLKTPNLGILDGAYIDRQLSNYVQGLRGSEAYADQQGMWMRGIAQQINDPADRKAIIDYISNLPVGASSGSGH